MSAISVNLPDSLQKRLEELAKKENVSIEQFISTALAEKISAMLTEEYLEQRARRASRDKFERAMEKVPVVEPEEYDRL
jgi:predicted transcriptional regulator